MQPGMVPESSRHRAQGWKTQVLAVCKRRCSMYPNCEEDPVRHDARNMCVPALGRQQTNSKPPKA
eukprot:7419296-Alexandrium_andersonii.AAC.1